ncbi:DNA-formamidopyrimidine glycosylase family protein [Arthrobacter castelli]|uniref:DNA-formamidopyrimidine glycosylase family protein n=1 Tax=Arthrobacter castelli TaxID=271431 RepID=UPI00047C4040|nr:DNA-formamidopyrimidine glycosylase family protein [Arthrobacter castelli]
MPEMPEVAGLVEFLRRKLVPDDGEPAVLSDVEIVSFSVLKTAGVPVESLRGLEVAAVERWGKFIAVQAGKFYLVIHLARAGWLRWSEEFKPGRLRPGKGVIALRVRCSTSAAPEAGFDVTEAGTKKSVAAYLVESLDQVPGVARLGPDALELDRDAFGAIIVGHRGQVKGLLRDQSVIAGIGNAYSDEILHAARLSPFTLVTSLDDEQVTTLYSSMQELLRSALEAASGRPAAELKDAKRRNMRVHGRAGESCPECGDTVREVSFADSALQYCPTCQTGGKPLADRRTSKFLK